MSGKTIRTVFVVVVGRRGRGSGIAGETMREGAVSGCHGFLVTCAATFSAVTRSPGTVCPTMTLTRVGWKPLMATTSSAMAERTRAAMSVTGEGHTVAMATSMATVHVSGSIWMAMRGKFCPPIFFHVPETLAVPGTRAMAAETIYSIVRRPSRLEP